LEVTNYVVVVFLTGIVGLDSVFGFVSSFLLSGWGFLTSFSTRVGFILFTGGSDTLFG
jgi:hypothetical protein